MNNYKPLIWVSTILLAILSLYVLVLMGRAADTAVTTNTVTFTGEGKATAKTDIAFISLSIITDGATSKEAQDKNSPKSQAVVKFLKSQGIEDKDVKTTGYNIYPQYKYSPTGITSIQSYQAVQSFEVKVRYLKKVSTILDGATSAGANQVSNLGLRIENMDKVQAEARKQAVEDAKKKAEELEDQVGIKLGKIVSYSENNSGWPIPVYDKVGMERGGMGGGGPSIPQGENEVIITVSISYQIK